MPYLCIVTKRQARVPNESRRLTRFRWLQQAKSLLDILQQHQPTTPEPNQHNEQSCGFSKNLYNVCLSLRITFITFARKKYTTHAIYIIARSLSLAVRSRHHHIQNIRKTQNQKLTRACTMVDAKHTAHRRFVRTDKPYRLGGKGTAAALPDSFRNVHHSVGCRFWT